jgi:AcrR family transcriptional regulator
MSISTAEPAARRERLLREASRIFAAKGFDKASTREICLAAGVNIGLISYYFGDKQGLYLEVLVQPVADVMARMPAADASIPLTEWLTSFYQAFLYPLQADEAALADAMRIFCREMIAPSKVYEAVCVEHIAPHHHALVQMLAQRCGAEAVDAELHHLGFALVTLAHDYWMSTDFMETLVPGLVRGPGAYQRLLARLVAYGQALIESEAGRRAGLHEGVIRG